MTGERTTSYGLYIIHNFAERMVLNSIVALGSPAWMIKIFHLDIGRFFLFVFVTVGLASLSWHFFEKPINNLKRYFPYPGKASPAKFVEISSTLRGSAQI